MEAEEFKVILVGESGVGKTSFVVRYVDGKFLSAFESTVGVDNRRISVQVDETPVNLQIWDTAGQERFKSIVERFFRNAHGAIVMYDVTNKDTFDALPWWLGVIRKNLSSGIPIILVANKSDNNAQPEVIEELAQDFAEEERLYLFHTSARDDVNVKEVFLSLATMMLADRKRTQDPDERTSLIDSGQADQDRNIRLTDREPPQISGCCSYFESTPKKGYVV